MWNWLKHAFAVETRKSLDVTPRQAELVERLCEEIVRRRMVAPALLVLETGRPLNFVASQAMHFFEPVVRGLFDSTGIREFANFLEQRGSIDYLLDRLEERDARETSPKP